MNAGNGKVTCIHINEDDYLDGDGFNEELLLDVLEEKKVYKQSECDYLLVKTINWRITKMEDL